jgi:RHS repeat-associated protein
VTSNATGPQDGTLSWIAQPVSLSWTGQEGLVPPNNYPTTQDWNITVNNSSKDLTAYLSWSYKNLDPNFTLALKDAATGSVLQQSTRTGGSDQNIDYVLPNTVGFTSPHNYVLEVTAPNPAVGGSFNLSASYEYMPNLQLQIESGSTVLATSAAGTEPATVSLASEPPGSYTYLINSTDPSYLAYGASYSLSVTAAQLGYANVTLSLMQGSTVLQSGSSSTGSLVVEGTLPASGTYTAQITDNSSDLSVPSYTITTRAPWQTPAQATLGLYDQTAGAAVPRCGATGVSPLNVSCSPSASNHWYKLTLTPTLGSASNGSLSASYPGLPLKEVITYDGNSHAVTIDDGAFTVTDTLSYTGRVLQHRVTADGGGVTEDTIFGYDGSGDSPAYSEPASDSPNYTSPPVVTTYVAGPAGLLAIDAGSSPTYPIQNGHGDVVGTADASGNYTANPAVDEFGNGSAPSNRLGWLGGDGRFSAGSRLGLIRMGVRLYDPALGRFLEEDPVAGGSANAYDYAAQDPVNNFDLGGTCYLNGHRVEDPDACDSDPGISNAAASNPNRGQGNMRGAPAPPAHAAPQGSGEAGAGGNDHLHQVLDGLAYLPYSVYYVAHAVRQSPLAVPLTPWLLGLEAAGLAGDAGIDWLKNRYIGPESIGDEGRVRPINPFHQWIGPQWSTYLPGIHSTGDIDW